VKLAILVRSFPLPSETFVVARFTALLERGWDVHVFCESSPPDNWTLFRSLAEPALRARVHVRTRHPSRVRVALLGPFVFLRTLVAAPLRALRYLARGSRAYGRGVAGHLVEDAALIRFGPDIVHFEFGDLAVKREPTGRLLGCAMIASFQGLDINYAGLDRDPGYYAPLWPALDAAHFVSEDLRRRAMTRGYPDDNGFVVYNGIDTTAFDPGSRRYEGELGTPTRPLRLLSTGRLHWKKGYAYALAAVAMLHRRDIEVRYTIVGDGDYGDAVRFDIADMGLTDLVTLTGALPQEAVRAELEGADVFVHPATSEGFCLAVTEAQAMGLPVVVSDADGLAENVEDGVSGSIVPRRDAAALADAIAQLAADASARERMGRAGISRVRERFTLERHVDGIEAMYTAVLRDRA
jgi:colanic acid/amylovoran biosynthesis glycosyltransferase